MTKLVALVLLVSATLAAQIPPPTSLPSKPFFIKKAWVIGGVGDWDYLTLDSQANRLYIAHGAEVQVVDVETGNLAGAVKGLREAHSIALDGTGELGYVSDGAANDIKVFDRRTFEVQGKIPLDSSPRALVFEPQTGLLLAVSASPAGAPPPTADSKSLQRYASQQWQREQRVLPSNPKDREAAKNPCYFDSHSYASGLLPTWDSNLILIDPAARRVTAEIKICGYAGFAAADGDGRIYAAWVSGDEILRIDAEAILNVAKSAQQGRPPSELVRLRGTLAGGTLYLDWRPITRPGTSLSVGGFEGVTAMGLGASCHTPRALAVDSRDSRIFVACNNLKMAVLNASRGDVVTTLPIGPDPDAVGYDPDRSLIFSANGGAQGSLTIIHRDVTDTYNVVQILPTRQQARTLAVNSSTGQVYLVTVIQVAQLRPPISGIGTLELEPQDASFQVLVVGN